MARSRARSGRAASERAADRAFAAYRAILQGRPDDTWAAVRDLDLTGREIGDDEIARWPALPALSPLRGIGLGDNDLTEAGLAALARCDQLSALRSLDLSFNDVDLFPVESLTAAPWFGALTRLDLSLNPLGDAGFSALAGFSAPPGPSLVHLSLNHCGPGPDGLAHLLQSPILARVRILDLRNAPFDAERVAALCGSPWLSRLQHLDISDNALGPDALTDADFDQIIAARDTLGALRTLRAWPERLWGRAATIDIAQHRRVSSRLPPDPPPPRTPEDP